MSTVIEAVSFRLVEGTDETAFLKHAEAIGDFVKPRAGFIHRTFTRDAEGWLDIVEWQDHATAQAAATAFMEDPNLANFMEAIDKDSVKMRHLDVMATN